MKKAAPLMAALAFSAYAAVIAGCKSPTESIPKTEYAHEILVQASYFFSGGAATGTYQVTMVSYNQTYEANIGERLILPKTFIKDETCNILINAVNAHPREFRDIVVTNTTLTTNVAESSRLNVDGLLNNILYDGKNASWTPRTITLFFCAGRPEGARLPQYFIDEVKRAANNIQRWSGGYIQSLSCIEHADKPYGTTIPAEGEVWIHPTDEIGGCANTTYPAGGNKVTSSKIIINPNGAGPSMAYEETGDAFIQGEQNFTMSFFEINPGWWPFMMNRPRDTNSYTITREKESQTGIDSFSELRNDVQVETRNNLVVPIPTNAAGDRVSPWRFDGAAINTMPESRTKGAADGLPTNWTRGKNARE